MAETIAKTGVKRDSGMLYYIKSGDVWGAPLKKAGAPKGKASKVAAMGVELDYAKKMYYVGTDNSGELVVMATNRQVGGSKRKKGAKKAAPKKAAKAAKKGAKKTSAKKAAPKKKAGGKKGKKK